MGRSSLLFLCAVAAMAQNVDVTSRGGVRPEGQQVMSGSGKLKDGILVQYRTVLRPPAAAKCCAGGIGIDPAGILHRDIQYNGASFGYDLVVDAVNPATGIQVSFRPLTGVTPAAAPLPEYPPPETVQSGDTIALDLMVSADGKERLTDYLRFFAKAPEPAGASGTSPARDFTIDDGPVRFDLTGIRVFVNGRQFDGLTGFAIFPGSTFWFVIPNRGRYILSLQPHDGFVQAGEVRDNVIRFQDAGQHYEFRTMSNIVGSGGAFHLYLLRDANFRPKPGMENAISGGTGRLQDLLPKP